MMVRMSSRSISARSVSLASHVLPGTEQLAGAHPRPARHGVATIIAQVVDTLGRQERTDGRCFGIRQSGGNWNCRESSPATLAAPGDGGKASPAAAGLGGIAWGRCQARLEPDVVNHDAEVELTERPPSYGPDPDCR